MMVKTVTHSMRFFSHYGFQIKTIYSSLFNKDIEQREPGEFPDYLSLKCENRSS